MSKTPDRFVTTRLPEPEFQQLAKRAYAEDRSVSATIRQAIRHYLNGEGKAA